MLNKYMLFTMQFILIFIYLNFVVVNSSETLACLLQTRRVGAKYAWS